MQTPNSTNTSEKNSERVKPSAQFNELWARIFGAVLAVIGLILGKFMIFDLLEHIRVAHDAAIKFDSHATMLPPLVISLGLLMLIAGPRGLAPFKKDPATGKPKRIAYVLLIAMLIPSVCVDSWFNDELSKLGYSKMDHNF